MNFREGQRVSGYTASNNIFEGYVINRDDGMQVVLNEDKQWIPINELNLVKITEDEAEETKRMVIDNVLSKLDKDKWNKASNEEKISAAKSEAEKFKLDDKAADEIKAALDANALGIENIKTEMDKYKVQENNNNNKKEVLRQRVKEALEEEFGKGDYSEYLDIDNKDTEDENFYVSADDEITPEFNTEDEDGLFGDDDFENEEDESDEEVLADPEFDDIYFSDDEDSNIDDIDLDFSDFEDEADDDVEKELDYYIDENGYDEAAIFEHLCTKFNFVDKKEKFLETTNNSIPDSILKLSESIALYRFVEKVISDKRLTDVINSEIDNSSAMKAINNALPQYLKDASDKDKKDALTQRNNALNTMLSNIANIALKYKRVFTEEDLYDTVMKVFKDKVSNTLGTEYFSANKNNFDTITRKIKSAIVEPNNYIASNSYNKTAGKASSEKAQSVGGKVLNWLKASAGF